MCLQSEPGNDYSPADERDKAVTIIAETYSAALVMRPGEIDALIADTVPDTRANRRIRLRNSLLPGNPEAAAAQTHATIKPGSMNAANIQGSAAWY